MLLLRICHLVHSSKLQPLPPNSLKSSVLLNVSNVHKSYGVDQILRGLNLRLDLREKVALVGRNGTGKTTFLKILTGQLEPDQGSVHITRGATVGYLRQEVAETTRTVLEEAE